MTVTLGLLRAADLDLALPLAALREVVPCPTALTSVPVEAPGLLGVMTLRSTIVPVVDLLHVLGRDHPRTDDQVVVVIAHDGLLMGLLVDEIRGLATITPEHFVEVARGPAGMVCTRSFHHPEEGHVVSMIDPDAALSLPGIPVVQERVDPVETGDAGAIGGRTRSLTLVRCGDLTLALDVAFVHSTIPSPALAASHVDGPTCLGTTTVAGYDVATVDLPALLGLGTLAGTTLGCGLVLDLPDGQVVLGATDMVGLHDVPAELVVPLPRAASTAPEVLTHVAEVEGVGACLVLDGDRLRTHREVVAFSRLATEAGSAEQTEGEPGSADRATGGAPVSDDPTARRGAARGPAHLAYRAGIDIATELGQVVEVLAYPDDLVPSSGSDGVLGFVVHRGAAVPVLDLARLLRREREDFTASSRLLLLDVDGDPVAFAVNGLHAILRLAWRDEAQPTTSHPGNPVAACPLVQLETLPGLLPALDLLDVARRSLPPAA